METSKIVSYFGFAKRAGKLTLGVNAAATLKRGVYLLAADAAVAKHSRKTILALKERLGCPLLFFEGLGALVGREGCKLAAVREEHLAAAIVRAADGT